MVDHITTIGKLLELPDLEPDTKQTINKAMRDLIERYVQHKPPEGMTPEEVAKQALGEGTFREWLNGPQGGDT